MAQRSREAVGLREALQITKVNNKVERVRGYCGFGARDSRQRLSINSSPPVIAS